MLEILICALIIGFGSEMKKYYKKTGDGSLEGFLEHLKNSYYKKPESRPKQEPRPGSDAHYAAWREEQLKKKKQSRE